MIVYRLLKYEGSPADIAEMFRVSINGEYTPPGKLLVTAAPVEPRVVEENRMLLFALQQVAGKRWSPQPPKPTARAAAGFGRPMRDSYATADAIKLLERIDNMLESDEYHWAEETLSGIRRTVETAGRVTEGQETAIDNIEAACSQRGIDR